MSEPAPGSRRLLPFRTLWPFLAGAGTGVALRLIFNAGAMSAFDAMSGAFIFLAPVVVGAVTVYIAERSARRSWAYCFGAGALANVLFVLGTMLILIEGIICAILIVPLFAIVGGVAGLVMGAVCRLTNWPKQMLYGIAVLPFMVAPLEAHLPLRQEVAHVERRIVIQAAPERVWRELLDARDIRGDEIGDAWLHRIGVPVPESGVTRETPEGKMRRVTMGKDIHFEEVFQAVDEPRHVRWTYRFDPDSFPAHALDEHVVVGGKYFDVKDTAYDLAPLGSSTTELRVRMGYRVSTRFNWYADPLARFLMGDLAQSNLDFYRRRSEAPNARSVDAVQ